MPKMLKRLKGIAYGISKTISFGGELAICVLILLVSYSAISRYLFSQGVPFMEELGGLLLMAIAFLTFAYVFIIERHIKVTLITNKLPRMVRGWFELAAGVLTLAFLIIFIKLSWEFVRVSIQLDCHTVNANLYEVPWMALMPAGAGVLALTVLVFCIDRAYKLISKKELMEEKEVAKGEIEDKTF